MHHTPINDLDLCLQLVAMLILWAYARFVLGERPLSKMSVITFIVCGVGAGKRAAAFYNGVYLPPAGTDTLGILMWVLSVIFIVLCIFASVALLLQGVGALRTRIAR